MRKIHQMYFSRMKQLNEHNEHNISHHIQGSFAYQ